MSLLRPGVIKQRKLLSHVLLFSDDSAGKEVRTPPWEEENGIYNLMVSHSLQVMGTTSL